MATPTTTDIQIATDTNCSIQFIPFFQEDSTSNNDFPAYSMRISLTEDYPPKFRQCLK